MIKRIFIHSLFLVALFGQKKLYAQALNYSQYYNAPLLTNPANTGFNPDYDYRAGMNYRTQWASVGTPYKTMGVWGDAKLFANYLPTDNAALRLLPADQIFAPQNFGTGTDNKIAFDAIKGSTFRYMANTILNAAFIQI